MGWAFATGGHRLRRTPGHAPRTPLTRNPCASVARRHRPQILVISRFRTFYWVRSARGAPAGFGSSWWTTVGGLGSFRRPGGRGLDQGHSVVVTSFIAPGEEETILVVTTGGWSGL